MHFEVDLLYSNRLIDKRTIITLLFEGSATVLSGNTVFSPLDGGKMMFLESS